MNLEIKIKQDTERVNEINMRIKELEEIKTDKLNDLNDAEKILTELKQKRELAMAKEEKFKSKTNINKLYINKCAASGRMNFNLEKLNTLKQMSINGISKVERNDVSLPYSDDFGAKAKANTEMAGLGLLVLMALRKKKLLEIISSLVLALYFGNKIQESKDYISVDRAFTKCTKKLLTARKEFCAADGKVKKIEEMLELFNNIYNSEELLCYMDEWSKVILEIQELISQIDNEILVLLNEKMILENTSVNTCFDIDIKEDKVKKMGVLK